MRSDRPLRSSRSALSYACIPLALSLFTATQPATAYDMNPIDVECWGQSAFCSVTKLTEGLKYPVHETITLLAYDYYLDPENTEGGRAKTSAETLKQRGVLRDLVLGSQWNDDPDSLLRQNVTRAYQWYALFKDAQQQAQCKENSALPSCRAITVTANPMMLYRSHFGDFQFIHSMASSQQETALDTQAKMLAWAKFTYTLSISSNNLAKEPIDGPAITAFSDIASYLGKPGWTVGALFDPIPGGEWKRSFRPGKFGTYVASGNPRVQHSYKSQSEAVSVKHMALGSLLHMIQDSYSDAHTERKGSCNPLAREKGAIISFRNYVYQSSDDHAHADINPKWLENGKLKKNNPLWASAKLIQYSFSKTPWEGEVEAFLKNEVLALSNPGNAPTTGDLPCYLGTQ